MIESLDRNNMFTKDSALLNLPGNLNQKEAIFFDGMRHSAQIVDLSYLRLCKSLTELSLENQKMSEDPMFTHVFLDAWAFVDATDRFRCLWEMQPNSENIPSEFSPSNVRLQLQTIRDVRNVSAHIAQKIDQIIALNASVLGSINWVTLVSQEPLKIKTHFIRPGIMRRNTQCQFAMPNGEVSFIHGSGCISLAAGKYEANLSDAYKFVSSLVLLAEYFLEHTKQATSSQECIPTDMFGSAELDTNML